jgi:malonyl-CoA O-methyltransferase
MSENSSQPPLTTPPTIDPIAANRWLQSNHSKAVWLQDEIGRRMYERLEWIRLQPTSWLDWLPLSGGLHSHALVSQHYPHARPLYYESSLQRQNQIDQYFSQTWLQRLFTKLKLTPETWQPEAVSVDTDYQVDFLWSNMTLHLAWQPQIWLQRWHDLIKPQGFLMFSCLGPDTLRELRQEFTNDDSTSLMHEFTDMHDWGDMLVQSGFSEPVMDMEQLTLTYMNAQDLLRDLRLCGRNISVNRSARVHSRDWLTKFSQLFEKLKQRQGGDRVKLTVEVIYGHAIRSESRIVVEETTKVSLQQMKKILAQK